MYAMARRIKTKNIMRSRLPLRVAVSVFSYVGTPVDGTWAETLAYSYQGAILRGLRASSRPDTPLPKHRTRYSMNAPGDRGLLRAIGRWDLLALVINGIVGAGIFGLPAKVYALLGVNGLWAIIACALIIGLVILCFAEVASRFMQTGGPFVYASTAFGPFSGFLTGWVLWVARVTGCCAICSLLLQYTAYFSATLNEGTGRVAAAVFIVGVLTLVHFFGIKRTVLFGNIVTVGKLLPLLIFIAFGLLHMDPARFAGAGPPINAHFAQAVLLLGFAFVGWESSVVTAGETRDPQRDLPFALILGLSAVAILCAALRGQGVALTAPLYMGSKLRSGRLVRLGQTLVTFGDYWLLEGTDRANAKARAAFVAWLDGETQEQRAAFN
jgi:hypothetical protein